jgi:large subunit ribosomal protein L34
MSKHTLNGSKRKAVKTSGFRARISTKNGRKILKQRRQKGRKHLVTVFLFKK